MSRLSHGPGRGRSLRMVGLGALLVAAIVAGPGRAGRVAAQDATPVAGQPATVTVLGHGSVSLTPDIAMVTVGVQVMKATLPEAQSEATTQMTAILDAIKAAGIDESDIQTTNYSVNVLSNYDNTGTPTEVIGYQVSNQVNVTVRDLDKVSTLLDDVVAAGANTIYGISFGISDPSDAQTQARTAAVADAKKRAEELAAAAGLSLGRVLSISEGGSQAIPYYDNAQFASGKGGAPVQFGSNDVSVDVQVTYELV